MKTESDFAIQQEKYFDDISVAHGKKVILKESRALSLEFEALVRALGELRGKRVLDIGCGSGRHALRIAKFASEVTGIDISKKSIDLANKTAQEIGITNFQGLVGSYDQPIRNRYFDTAFMVNVIHHIDDIGVVLRSAESSLKEDGQMIIFEFNPLNILFIPFLMLHGQTRAHFNAKYLRSNLYSLQSYLKQNGFSIVSVERYAFFPTLLYNFSPLFQWMNDTLNKIPIINMFCAFHIIKCRRK